MITYRPPARLLVYTAFFVVLALLPPPIAPLLVLAAMTCLTLYIFPRERSK